MHKYFLQRVNLVVTKLSFINLCLNTAIQMKLSTIKMRSPDEIAEALRDFSPVSLLLAVLNNLEYF